ncbi:MAG: 3-hydroxybutyryl-CoA dehydrogenase [Acidobacteria bacterium]|nr:3-hydroxybutyryl-CoA dehydrogenase [Acidobacteriota bacterium]
MEIKRIGVVGAGTMGAGIAQVCLGGGFEVVVREVADEHLESGLGRIRAGLDKWVAKDIVEGHEADAMRGALSGTTLLEDLYDCDLVIEAIIEDLEAKAEVFRVLDAGCPAETILASNTSSISITRLAASTARADRVVGMHFFNPVPLMKLVEIVRGEATSDDVHSVIDDLARKLQKTPVTVADYPGFVSNRVLMPMINEAVFCLQEGVATAEDIDTVMQLGMAHPMGPLRLADLVGLDVCLAIMEVLHQGYGDSKYRACPLLRRKVDAGHIGRKSGQGFYTY